MSDGTGSIYRRGNTWWIDYSFRGERHRESSGSTKKKVAKKLLQKRMKEMAEGGPMVDEEDVTLEDLREAVVTDYKVNGRKTLRRVKQAFGHLEDHFGKHARAVDINTHSVRGYIAARQEDGMARATINRELATLRRGFNLLREDGLLSRTPHVPTLKTSNTRTGFLTMADVEAIADEATDYVAPVIRFAALTGWRKGEIIAFQGAPGLRWHQVDFEAGEVRLEPGTTKNDEGRAFPFAALPPLEELLRQQRAYTDEVEKREGRIVAHVFHRDGEPVKSLRKAWNGACKRAGMPDALFHDLRRSAVRNLERAGVSRSVAMELTGHKTESVYRRYAITDKTAKREGVEKLASLYGDAGQQEDRTVEPIRQAEGG